MTTIDKPEALRPGPVGGRAASLLVWNYVRLELLPVSWALTEISLLTPLALAFMPWARLWSPVQVGLLLLLVMLIPFNLIRLMSTLGLPTSWQQNLMVVGLLLTSLLTVRGLLYSPYGPFDLRWMAQFYVNLAAPGNQLWIRDLFLFLFVVAAWWRGIRLAGREVDIGRAGLQLRVGGLILAPLVILISRNRLTWNIYPFILLFFLAALTAVALIRAEQLELDRSGLSAAVGPRWVSGMFAASLAVVGLAGFLARVAAGEAPVHLVRWLAPLWQALFATGRVSLETVAFVASPLLRFVEYVLPLIALAIGGLMAWILARLRPALVQLQESTGLTLWQNWEVEESAPLLQGTTGEKLIYLLLMLALVLTVALALRRRFRQTEAASSSERLVLRRRPARGGGWRAGILERLGALSGWRTAVSIRRIYRNMCRLAGTVGYPRSDAETPYEYLSTLSKAWPENGTDVALITRAYVRVRYGELPESQEEVAAIRAAWARLAHTPPVIHDSIRAGGTAVHIEGVEG